MSADLKNEIKKDIVEFSRKINKLDTEINYTPPIIINIYIGKESCQQLGLKIADAYNHAFSLKLIQTEIEYDYKNTILKDELIQRLTNISEKVNLKSANIYLVFCSLMHDPVYKEMNIEECINQIETDINEIKNLDINLNKTAFYGIFSQNKKNETYQFVYNFLTKAKILFKAIYHLEIPFYINNYTGICRTIALNTILDKYNMKQYGDEYCWQSIYLHELRTVELVLCKLLLQNYENQISDSNMYDENADFLNDLREIVVKQLEILFPYRDSSIALYLPLKFYQHEREKKGVFSFLLKSKKDEYNFQDALSDDSQMQQFVYEMINDKKLNIKDYEIFVKNIVLSLPVIHKDINLLQNLLFEAIENTINSEQLATKQKINNVNVNSLQEYIKNVYQIEFNRQLSERKITFLKEIKVLIRNGQTVDGGLEFVNLSQIVKDIIDQNNQMRNCLIDLIRNDFGGNLLVDQTKFEVNITSYLNENIKNILQMLDISQLKKYLSQDSLFDRTLEKFINDSLKDAVNFHNIGKIGNGVEELENIQMTMLLNMNEEMSKHTKALLERRENILIDKNNMYLHNSFQIISSRSYKTYKGIINYK